MANLASRIVSWLLAAALGTALDRLGRERRASSSRSGPTATAPSRQTSTDRSERARAMRRERERRAARDDARRAARASSSSGGASCPARSPRAAWRAVRLPLARRPARCARRCSRCASSRGAGGGTGRYRLKPFRSDEATPDQVQRFLESLHQIVLRRWWQRLFLGQPSVALEFHAVEGEAGRQLRLALVVRGPAGARRGDRRAPDRLLPRRPPRAGEGRAAAGRGAILRMKKRKPLHQAAARPSSATSGSLVDALCNTMASAGGPVVGPVRPDPDAGGVRPLRALALPRRGARAGIRPRQGGGQGPGHALRGRRPGARGRARGPAPAALLRRDPDRRRHASTSRATVAGTLRGESRAENQLVERHAILRRRLYASRLRAAIGNPLPSWSRGVLSSTELACALAPPVAVPEGDADRALVGPARARAARDAPAAETAPGRSAATSRGPSASTRATSA